jgi:hypothetical protein
VQNHRVIKEGWHEFSVKNVFHLIKDDMTLAQYLPIEEMSLGRWVDK